LVGSSGLGLGRLIDALSQAPAKIAGITPPSLKEGALAELALVDPEALWSPARADLRSKSRNSPFMNHELKGQILLTTARGGIVFDRLGGGS
jgi:dihydroorotase